MTDRAKVLEEINKELDARRAGAVPNAHLVFACELLRKKLRLFSDSRKRNAILYYSSWPTNDNAETNLNEADLDNLMTMTRGLQPKLGLDFIINTPGGQVTVAESLVRNLRMLFNDNIEVFIPYAAMSAGTMIACASKCIHMSSHASLGPADPILNGYSAIGLLADLEIAKNEIREDPSSAAMWRILFEKYPPAFIRECLAVVNWSRKLLTEYLNEVMFADGQGKEKTPTLVSHLTEITHTITHSRHIGIDEAKKIGLVVKPISENAKLGELLCSIHDFCLFIMEAAHQHKIFCSSSSMFVTSGAKRH